MTVTPVKIPWALLFVIFAILPAIIFSGIGLVEKSFVLENEGVYVFSDSSEMLIVESEGNYYIIHSSQLNSTEGLERDEEGNVIEKWFPDLTLTGYKLTSKYIGELERCSIEKSTESCIITNNGILEDPIFLGYFPAATLTLLACRPLTHGFNRIIMTTSSRLVVLKGEEDEESQLTESERIQLTIFQESIFESLLPWQILSHKQDLTPENTKRLRKIRKIPITLSIFGGVFLIIGTLQHWNAIETYGFDIWASDNYLIGFFARFLYESILYVVFFPMMFYWLFCSIYLKHQTLTQLEEKKGFRFIRFSYDEAGGMGEFGNQSLRNVVVMLPLLLPIVAYLVFYPVTPLLIIGVAGFIIALPLIFLWPLLGARRAMVRMKEEEMLMLATHFERSYLQHKKSIKESPNDLELHAITGEALRRSEQIYQEMSALPTWPFSRSLIAKFASLIAMVASAFTIVMGA